MAKNSYSAEDIEVLEGLEPVRQRPGMYIGGTDTIEGLHHLVWEILDNSVDEVMNGHASEIGVTLHKDGESVTVTDNGRGIPVDKHPKFKKSALELILTTLHAGGKFSDKNYKTAGGLHGVGSSVVNALSEDLIATVRRDGQEYQQKFSRGKPKTKLETTKDKVKGSGTTIFFRPDSQIFAKRVFSPKLIRETLQTKAYLHPGLKIIFNDEVNAKSDTFQYQDGIIEYLKHILGERKARVVSDEYFSLTEEGDVSVSIALAWTSSTKEEFISYANGINTKEGGSHDQGVKAGIVKAIRNYLNVHDIAPKGIKIGAEDIREGITCLVSVKLSSDKIQAQFQGQTKDKLNNPEVQPIVENVARGLEQLLNQKPSVAKSIIDRVVMAARARAASREASQSVRRKIGISHRLTLPGKLADCSSTKPDESELFIVEGDSAGGSTKQGRDRKCQAVLPLRGKVLNTIASANKKIGDNKELSNIISALGCGSGIQCDVNRLRYAKVIILTDADADGMHIATLLMAFFFQHLRPVIEAGSLYLGKPPLYRIVGKLKGSKQTKKDEAANPNGSSHWAYSDEEMKKISSLCVSNEPRITRFKGLGEMNPDTLWFTTLNPETRTLLRVTIDDEQEVIDGLNALMGSDPSARFELIQNHASEIEVDV